MLAEAFKPVFTKVIVSCGNGKFAADGVPPDDNAQPNPVLAPPVTRFQYFATPVVNVMPELPPASPSLVPTQLAAPAPVYPENQHLLKLQLQQLAFGLCRKHQILQSTLMTLEWLVLGKSACR